MTLPDGLAEMIRTFEGFRSRSYQCPAGVWTIGYGSTGPDIGAGMAWTREQAEIRMRRDAEAYVTATRRLCPSLTGSRLAAVADFAYNLGATRLAGSTLRRKINRGDIAGAALEFGKWVRGGGRILPGLVARRKVEAALFLKG